MNILTMQDVSHQYSKTMNPILCNININFEKGKLYCIVGKSGAGKTTLITLLSGMEISTSGAILYYGNDIKKMDRDEYRSKKIGVVFQNYNLITNATALENIALSLYIGDKKQRCKNEKAYSLLENVGINRNIANRTVSKLSGGEQQRVAVARAISNSPDIIIADEPTNNLDSETEKSIMSILSGFAKQGKCVIVVTHSKSTIDYADEIWGISNGKILFIE